MEIIIFDRNGDLTEAFRDTPFTTFTGEATDVSATAIVSPANSFGFMDGGIDWTYTKWFGPRVQEDIQRQIKIMPFGELLVGQALSAATGNEQVPYLIAAPTMRVPMRILDIMDIMLATRAAVALAAWRRFESIAIPGMGTGCGSVRPDFAAKAMQEGIRQALSGQTFPASWREAQDAHFALSRS